MGLYAWEQSRHLTVDDYRDSDHERLDEDVLGEVKRDQCRLIDAEQGRHDGFRLGEYLSQDRTTNDDRQFEPDQRQRGRRLGCDRLYDRREDGIEELVGPEHQSDHHEDGRQSGVWLDPIGREPEGISRDPA